MVLILFYLTMCMQGLPTLIGRWLLTVCVYNPSVDWGSRGHPQPGVSVRHPYLIMEGYTLYIPVLRCWYLVCLAKMLCAAALMLSNMEGMLYTYITSSRLPVGLYLNNCWLSRKTIWQALRQCNIVIRFICKHHSFVYDSIFNFEPM